MEASVLGSLTLSAQVCPGVGDGEQGWGVREDDYAVPWQPNVLPIWRPLLPLEYDATGRAVTETAPAVTNTPVTILRLTSPSLPRITPHQCVTMSSRQHARLMTCSQQSARNNVFLYALGSPEGPPAVVLLVGITIAQIIITGKHFRYARRVAAAARAGGVYEPVTTGVCSSYCCLPALVATRRWSGEP